MLDEPRLDTAVFSQVNDCQLIDGLTCIKTLQQANILFLRPWLTSHNTSARTFPGVSLHGRGLRHKGIGSHK